MIFDDDFLKLTGQSDVDSIEIKDDSVDDVQDFDVSEETVNVKKWISGSDKKEETPNTEDSAISFDLNSAADEKFSSEYGNPDFDYVIESDLVTPTIVAKKNEKPLVICVDDDFGTLDLLGIYLKRDYDYEAFSGPREAIFFLNQRVPDLILLDCKIHTMRAKTFMEIIMAGPGNKNVKFAYTGTEAELAEIDWNYVPDYVVGKLKRPIARGELQKVLDVIKKD